MNKKQMLESVKSYLSLFGKVDEMVLKAMDNIDRKYFVRNLKEAYIDTALLIGSGQTISQPSTVARMLSLLELKKDDNVLEIGTGSAWNAGLIAYIVNSGKVLSFEIHEDLVSSAKENIKKFNFKNLEIKKQDFRKINKKFDKIIFTCGILPEKEKEIEEYAKNHLNKEGILVCAFRRGPLIIFKKIKDKLLKNYTSEEYVFVPLVLE